MVLHKKKRLRKKTKASAAAQHGAGAGCGAGTSKKRPKSPGDKRIGGCILVAPLKNQACFSGQKLKRAKYDRGGVKSLYSPFNKFSFVPQASGKSYNKIKLPPYQSPYVPTGLSPKEKMYVITCCQTRPTQYTKLKTLAANAIKNNKIFAMYGYCDTVRKALVERGWVEKIPPKRMNLTRIRSGTCDNSEVHAELERLLLSDFVEKYTPNFIWRTKEEQGDTTIDMGQNCTTMVNKLNLDAMWTTKQGLCSSIKRNYWFYIEDVAEVSTPRTYNSYDSGEIEGFIKDFKITACTSLLKWVLAMVSNNKPVFVESGKISINVFLFALNRCKEYLFRKQNKDIDKDIGVTSNGQWNTFLKKYYLIISKLGVFEADKKNQLPLYLGYAKFLLKEIHKYRPQLSCEGCHNIWIVKPAHCSRGRGIRLHSNLGALTEMLSKANLKFVIQKYIEEPLLIHETKFDIRQYYLITSTYPLVIWMYKDCYLKFSSQKYNLKNYHESIHLTNNAVQKKYKNCKNRHEELPLNNMWDSDKYKSYLIGIGKDKVWDNNIYPGMKKSIIGIMLSCQDTLTVCKNRFELYGCDFILDKYYKPWLIEINSCPDLRNTTPVTAKICPAVLTDIIKVVIDFPNNPNSPTGRFECIYRQPVTIPRFSMCADLYVRGYALPSEYFYKGNIEIMECYDDPEIGKERDVKGIMRKMKQVYDEEIMINPNTDDVWAITDKVGEVIPLTDSDVELSDIASCITQQLDELLDRVTAVTNSKVNNIVATEINIKSAESIINLNTSSSNKYKLCKSVTMKESFAFSPLDDGPIGKGSWTDVSPIQHITCNLPPQATNELNANKLKRDLANNNKNQHDVQDAAVKLLSFLREKEKECRR